MSACSRLRARSSTATLVALLSVAMSVPIVTFADPVDPKAVARAEELYRAGRSDFDAGDYEAACPKLARSLENGELKPIHCA